MRALAELGRVSNLPTVLSNVLVGVVAALPTGQPWPIRRLMLALVACSALYLAGMILNDVADAAVDARERPHRPIPSRRVRRSDAALLVVTLFGIALAALSICGAAALLSGLILATTIIAYDLLHTRHVTTVALMGLCRGLVYVVAAAAVSGDAGATDPTVLVLAGGLALYVVALTLLAREEAGGRLGANRWLAVALPMLPLGAAASAGNLLTVFGIAAATLLTAWLWLAARQLFRTPPRVVSAVLRWLAGICLVDALFLATLGNPLLALLAGGLFGLTAWGHRRVIGT